MFLGIPDLTSSGTRDHVKETHGERIFNHIVRFALPGKLFKEIALYAIILFPPAFNGGRGRAAKRDRRWRGSLTLSTSPVLAGPPLTPHQDQVISSQTSGINQSISRLQMSADLSWDENCVNWKINGPGHPPGRSSSRFWRLTGVISRLLKNPPAVSNSVRWTSPTPSATRPYRCRPSSAQIVPSHIYVAG